MDSLIENRYGGGQLFRQMNYAGILPRAFVGSKHHAEGLDSLVLPDVLAIGFNLAWLVLRINGAAHNGNPQVVILHAVTVLGIVKHGEPVRLAAAVAGNVKPTLPRVFVAIGLARLEAVSDFVCGH